MDSTATALIILFSCFFKGCLNDNTMNRRERNKIRMSNTSPTEKGTHPINKRKSFDRTGYTPLA